MTQTTHDYYLDCLVNRLHKVNEDPREIEWILKDGIWLREKRNIRRSLCDLILVYQDGIAVPIELKGSMAKERKAISQLNAGHEFIEQVLHLKSIYGKFVVYLGGDVYTYKIFER